MTTLLVLFLVLVLVCYIGTQTLYLPEPFWQIIAGVLVILLILQLLHRFNVS